MPIKFKNSSIENEEIQKIIEFYNKNKPLKDEPLEILNRCESGFQIMIKEKKNIPCLLNEKYKQLRWKNKYLVPYNNIKSFNFNEEKLLYYSMRTVFGNDVIFEE